MDDAFPVSVIDKSADSLLRTLGLTRLVQKAS
jgi:hypothetical protein